MTKTTRIHSDVPSPRAFTLVELLIVISVIAILIAIVLASSKGVVQRQQERVTQNLLVSLDRALDEYKTEVGAFPVYNATAYEAVPGPDNVLTNFPKASGGDGKDHPARPDASVFIQQAKGFGEVDAVFQQMPSKFLQITSAEGLDDKQRDLTPSVIDSWGEDSWPTPDNASRPYQIRKQQVVYYIHPENVLAQALYGQCSNGRPYFMSAGVDRKYGLAADVAFDTDADGELNTDGKHDGETDPDFKIRVESFLKDNLYSYKDVGAFNTDTAFFTDIRADTAL